MEGKLNLLLICSCSNNCLSTNPFISVYYTW